MDDIIIRLGMLTKPTKLPFGFAHRTIEEAITEITGLRNKKTISHMMTAITFVKGLTQRSRNCLEKNHGRITDDQLFELLETKPDGYFLSMPNFGRKGMTELRNVHRVMTSLREKDIDIDLIADNERLRRECEDMRMILAKFRNKLNEVLE